MQSPSGEKSESDSGSVETSDGGPVYGIDFTGIETIEVDLSEFVRHETLGLIHKSILPIAIDMTGKVSFRITNTET